MEQNNVKVYSLINRTENGLEILIISLNKDSIINLIKKQKKDLSYSDKGLYVGELELEKSDIYNIDNFKLLSRDYIELISKYPYRRWNHFNFSYDETK